ncbi:MAG: hypothetical protein IKW21_03685, partial [Lachnospiraceae bacterium]|nr:hypothetical protein [Lachnospiraceae bacterium]
LNGIIEEMADVEVVLAQVKYIYDIVEEVDLCRQYKIDRQLLRIKKAEEHMAMSKKVDIQADIEEISTEDLIRQLKM